MSVWKDQYTALTIEAFKQWKENAIAKQLDSVINETLKENKIQNANFEKAMQHMLQMRQFLSSPGNILGSEKTKHGEIAENFEVHIRNARATLDGQEKVATFEGVGRTAPEDFILNGIKIQAKYINGTNKTLSSVLEHFEKYKDPNMNYMIPKDQFDVIQNLRDGNNTLQLTDKSVRAILNKVSEIELQTGRSFNEIVTPSVTNYEDVQLGKAYITLFEHEESLVEEHYNKIDQINENAEKQKQNIEANIGPSMKEGIKIAGAAATISATLTACTSIYTKVKSGTKISDFTAKDWKEVGLNAGKSGTKASVTAGTIYALTSLTDLTAPFAAALTSAAMGVTSLLVDYNNDEIELDEVVAQGQILCLEAGIAAIGGALGQMVIPVPILGAVIGTVTTNFVWSIAKGKLIQREKEIKEFMDNYLKDLESQVDEIYHEIMNEINLTYAKFDNLIDAAFDKDANKSTLAAASIVLAREVGVDENQIIKDDEDLEAFFAE